MTSRPPSPAAPPACWAARWARPTPGSGRTAPARVRRAPPARLDDRGPRLLGLLEVGRTPLDQVGLQLDAGDRSGGTHEVGEQRRGPRRARAHVEDPVSGAGVEQPQHRRDRARLGVGLAVADRQGTVVPGLVTVVPPQEVLAGQSGECGGHGVHPRSLSRGARSNFVSERSLSYSSSDAPSRHPAAARRAPRRPRPGHPAAAASARPRRDHPADRRGRRRGGGHHLPGLRVQGAAGRRGHQPRPSSRAASSTSSTTSTTSLPFRDRMVALVALLQRRFLDTFDLMRAVGMVAPPHRDKRSAELEKFRREIAERMVAPRRGRTPSGCGCRRRSSSTS